MSFKTLKKKYYISALIFAMFISALFFAVSFDAKNVRADNYNTGATVDIGFSYDFTDYGYDNGEYFGNSTNWMNYVYESNNMRLSPDTNVTSLSAGSGNAIYIPDVKSEGYITYKIRAGEKQGENTMVFGDLSVIATGRVFHYSHGDCKECLMKVYVAVEDGDFELVETIYADENGSPLTRTFDFSEKVYDQEYCYVKIVLVGYANDWVNMINLTVEGSSYYKGYAPVVIDILKPTSDTLVSIMDDVSVKQATASDGENEYQYTVSILDPNGDPINIEEDKFTASTIGKYTITYTVDDEGRVYTASYDVYCVEDSEKSGYVSGTYGNYSSEKIADEDNYIADEDGYFESTGDTMEIEGSVRYLLPLDFADKVTISFNIDRLNAKDLFEIGITSSSDNSVGDYTALGLYYKLSSEEVDGVAKFFLYEYYQDGSTLLELAKTEYKSFTGAHYIHIMPDGNNVLVLIDGNLSVGDYSVVDIDAFTEDNKAFVSYNASSRTKVEITNIINFIDFNGYDKTAFLDTTNYALSKDTSLTLSGDALKLLGGAGYLLPLNFASRFSFSFDIISLPAGATFEFALTSQPGVANFDTKSNTGLYYMIKSENSNLIISAYFQSGNGVISLGQYGLSKITGTHSMGINRRLDQGISTYFDGIDVFSYQNYTYVDLSKFVVGSNVYISYRSVKSEVDIKNLILSDVRTPTLTNPYDMTALTRRNYPTSGIVGDIFILPDAVMYDVIDGYMPYTITVKDTNGNEVELYTNSDGKQYFNVVYEGLYTVSYSSVDYSGNAVVDTKNITMSLKDGAPSMTFSGSSQIATYGRQGTGINLPKPTIRVDGERNNDLVDLIKITIIHPSGASIYKKVGDVFTPFDIGLFTIIYEVSNEVATTYAYFSVNVKKDADPEDSYTDALKSENWVTRTDGVMEDTDNGLMIYGENVGGVQETAYCTLPFEMSNGIELTIDLTGLADKSVIDNWFSIGIGAEPKHGHFGNLQSGYIYFMLFYEKGTYYVNAQYMSRDGGVNGLFGPIDMGTSGIVTLSLEKLFGSTSRTDHVNIYLNHQKTAYGTEDLITYSHLVDDENFAYLSVHNYGTTGNMTAKEFKAAVITDITVCDQEAPQFVFSSDLATSVGVGATVEIPTITVTDNLDPNFVYSIMLVNPLGEEISFNENSFVADIKGSYYLILRGYDKSGNYTYIINEIEVGKNSGCSGEIGVSGFVPLIILFVPAVIFTTLRRIKKRKY